MDGRFLGIDVGAETIKAVEVLVGEGGRAHRGVRLLVEHHKDPLGALRDLLGSWDLARLSGAAVTGRLGRLVALPRVPTRRAQAEGFRHRFDHEPATVVSIGSHGFSVLELRGGDVEVFRENSRCSQGTGNFLRQLVERFDLSIDRASDMAAGVEDPAPLSGRCPVILKTDMTHLANQGVDRARILAGLFDAVCDNVQVLVKPRLCPPRLLLCGGVAQSPRVRAHFARFLARHGLSEIDSGGDDVRYLDALGAALCAAADPRAVPSLDELLGTQAHATIERVPGLGDALPRVRRLPAPRQPESANGDTDLVLGFDIGSTGSKLVAFDRATRAPIWEGYVNTLGDPVGAARRLMQRFVDGPAARLPVRTFGATGSGREIVGSLLATCFGVERVYVLNEIAAHAEGALHHDARVDTIFEIGGQDAKYIRLAEGRVVDAAMNEACSAGTGSFIEEQGRKFAGIRDVVHLGQEAVRSPSGVSLGQHCSVFMAEIIDEAVGAGVETPAVIAGIYHSIVQNYLNRVKGSRDVGEVIFCQGMPFSSDALAAAVARETGSEVIVPPNPGTVGALGIALLACRAIPEPERAPVDCRRLLDAQVASRDTFVCRSTIGCGGAGNRCRIDRLHTVVGGRRQRFAWGGNCSLWDKGTGKRKLPDRAPDPFAEREALFERSVAGLATGTGRPRVALTDELQLKELFPFFANFFDALGFEVVWHRTKGRKSLQRGIAESNVSYCAPIQLYHGLVSDMAESDAALLFAPRLREMPRSKGESHAAACPMVQAVPDLLRWDLAARNGKHPGPRLVDPVIDFDGGNLDGRRFEEVCLDLARGLGVALPAAKAAFLRGRNAQREFLERSLAIGREALAFCRQHDVVPVVVLGRPYTIYNDVLNSHVPPLLREQGAMAIPIDCYPVDESVPLFEWMYWGHGQRNLRAVHQIRRTPDLYAIWCSNYSCGPDSFNLHFFQEAMRGRPFAILETDGHAGNAGTKTRVEAFLHCVHEDRRGRGTRPEPFDLGRVGPNGYGVDSIRSRDATVLIPRMGPGAATLAAALRGIGVKAEALPRPDRDALRLGRRHTSGKECVPMAITLGSLLQRLEREPDPTERFAFFMPTSNGPCRFGVYNVLHRLVLQRLGFGDRIEIWSPIDTDYFGSLPGGFSVLAFCGFAATDALYSARLDARATERSPGAAERIFEKHYARLLAAVEAAGRARPSLTAALAEVAVGRLFGLARLLRDAARDFAAHREEREVPTVLVLGEVYVRHDPFANDFLIERLEREGLRVRFAPVCEWIEYADHIARDRGEATGLGAWLNTNVQRRVLSRCHALVGRELRWPSRRERVADAVAAGRSYLSDALAGESILTLGSALHEWRAGRIDGAVSVGPLECMPTRIAEAQFFHVAEQEGLPTITLPVNGDPVDPELLAGFVFDVRRKFDPSARARRAQASPAHA